MYIVGFTCFSQSNINELRRSTVVTASEVPFHSSPQRQIHSKSVIQPLYQRHEQLAAKSYHEIIDEGESSSVEREDEDVEQSHTQPVKVTHILQSWNPPSGSFSSYANNKTPDNDEVRDYLKKSVYTGPLIREVSSKRRSSSRVDKKPETQRNTQRDSSNDGGSYMQLLSGRPRHSALGTHKISVSKYCIQTQSLGR